MSRLLKAIVVPLLITITTIVMFVSATPAGTDIPSRGIAKIDKVTP